jgi:glycosyltransferase involved in cell wall biosynthesis
VGFGWRAGDNAILQRFKIYKYFFPFFAFLKALSLHRKNHYDAVWSIMANYAGFGALFFKLVHPSVPFILTLQEGDPFSYIKRRVGLLYPLFKLIFIKSDSVTAISTYLADWAREMGAKGSITVVPNGVDVRKFKVESLKLKAEAQEKIKEAVAKFELAYNRAIKAEDFASRGYTKDAVDLWIKIFGDYFPAYG